MCTDVFTYAVEINTILNLRLPCQKALRKYLPEKYVQKRLEPNLAVWVPKGAPLYFFSAMAQQGTATSSCKKLQLNNQLSTYALRVLSFEIEASKALSPHK